MQRAALQEDYRPYPWAVMYRVFLDLENDPVGVFHLRHVLTALGGYLDNEAQESKSLEVLDCSANDFFLDIFAKSDKIVGISSDPHD